MRGPKQNYCFGANLENGEESWLFRKERYSGQELVILSAAHRLHTSKTSAGEGLIKWNAKIRTRHKF